MTRLRTPKGKYQETVRRLADAAIDVLHHDIGNEPDTYTQEVQALERKFANILRGKLSNASQLQRGPAQAGAGVVGQDPPTDKAGAAVGGRDEVDELCFALGRAIEADRAVRQEAPEDVGRLQYSAMLAKDALEATLRILPGLTQTTTATVKSRDGGERG